MKWGLSKRDHQLDKREFSPLASFKEEMDTLFKDFFGNEPTSLFSSSFSPKVDIREDEKAFFVSAELPGVTEKDISVELKDKVLIIKGEKKEESESKDKQEHRIERRYGCFERSFTIPDEVIADQIKASFKQGILKIEVPKDLSKTTKKLKVNVEN